MVDRTLYTGLYAYEPPSYLQEICRRLGGVNKYGEPNYRLVRAEGRRRFSGGRWFEWDKSTPLSERNAEYHRPLRVVIEVRPVAMYPGKHCWILERYMPADAYGCRELWEAPISMGGTMKWVDGEYVPSAGPYPARGDWETTGWEISNDALCENTVARAIGMIEQRLHSMPANPKQRAVEEMNAAQWEHEQQQKRFEQEAMDLLNEEGNVMDARTPGGQAEVHRMAEKIGIRNQLF